MNTVRAILDAEKEASGLCGEAYDLQDTRTARIEKEKETLAKQYADMTDTAITQAEKAETDRADAELARIEAETKRRIDALAHSFDASQEESVDRLFRLVIGDADDEQ